LEKPVWLSQASEYRKGREAQQNGPKMNILIENKIYSLYSANLKLLNQIN
jgi:hypothetical protein